MSETLDPQVPPVRDTTTECRLRFTPDQLLRESLDGMVRHESGELNGPRGLFLYSDETFSYHTRVIDFRRRNSPEYNAIVALSRNIKSRSEENRRLARRVELTKLPEQTPGIRLHLDVIMDQLTAQALRNVIYVAPDDSVQAHITFPKDELAPIDDFMASCKSLNERLLSDGRRPGVSAVKIIERTL